MSYTTSLKEIGAVRGCLSVTACKGKLAFAPDGPSWAQSAMTTSLARNIKPNINAET